MKIHQLLETPDKWTQGAFARLPDGKAVKSNHPNAVCWCLIGAICKCYDGIGAKTAISDAILAAAAGAVAGEMLSTWNDHPSRTHAEVLELVKRLDV